MREQHGAGGEVAPGRRGGVIRSLLGVERRLAEGDAEAGAVEVSSGKQPAGAGGAEERKAVVRVVAADMPPALQRRAFRCAREELAAMPHFPRRLEPKRLALALKKLIWKGLELLHTSLAVEVSVSEQPGDGVALNELCQAILKQSMVANHQYEQLIHCTIRRLCHHMFRWLSFHKMVSKFD